MTRQARLQIVGLLVVGALNVVVGVLANRLIGIYVAESQLTEAHVKTVIVFLTTFAIVSMVVFWILTVVLPFRTEVSRLRAQLQRVADGEQGLTQKNPIVAALEETITDLKQAQQRLLASERLATMGYFAGGIAHQIGNPLSAARQYAEVLQGQVVTRNNISEDVLAKLQNQLERIHRAIEGLSRFARPDRLALQNVDLGKLIVAIQGDLSVTMPAAEIAVTNVADIVVKTDLLALEQVFLNLIRNGIEAQSENPRIQVDLREMAGGCEIFIRDYGDGFPPDFSADNVLQSRKPGGSGLGIPLAIRLVELVGGTLTFANWEGCNGEYGGQVVIALQKQS